MSDCIWRSNIGGMLGDKCFNVIAPDDRPTCGSINGGGINGGGRIWGCGCVSAWTCNRDIGIVGIENTEAVIMTNMVIFPFIQRKSSAS